MGFRDYYRQFDDIDEAKLNVERRARRQEEKRKALERVPDVDLSGTEWPELPHSEIVNAAIARARGLVICNPNDPTGSYTRSQELGGLMAGLPEHVHVLLDEALVQFQDVEDVDACLRLVDAFPRLLVVRTFSKIYGLSGLRAGYAVGSNPGLLAAVAPVLGVNALTQAALEHALRTGDREIERRRSAVSRERARLTEGLRALGADVADSQANFVWVQAPGLSGDALAVALRRQGVVVAPGGPLGADDHVRIGLLNAETTERVLRAYENAVGPPVAR